MKRISIITKNLPTVENITNSVGNDVPNQFIITTKDSILFQSYSTLIALKTGGKTYLDRSSWDYSIITGKYPLIKLLVKS